MRKLWSLVIVGVLLMAAHPASRAASPGSDWPSLGFDAAQSNDNAAETTITAHNVLTLKVRWTAPIADLSYPIVAAGRVYVPVVSHAHVHVWVLDAATGKRLSVIFRDAPGGMVLVGGNLYVAGRYLQAVDPTKGTRLGQIDATPGKANGVFLYPVADQKLLLAGYASLTPGASASLYAINPGSNQVLWTVPSSSAQGAIGSGRILTQTARGSDFYDESTGKKVATASRVSSDWFAGDLLAYTVASIKRGKVTLYAMDGTGATIWKRAIGPAFRSTYRWPHAVDSSAVYVQTLTPQAGIQALNPESGAVLWTRPLADVQRMVLANGMLFVLTYALGQPTRLVVLHADTGAPIGALALSPGYYAFNADDGLMVADGMVFIRAVGPHGSQLVALGT